MRHVIAFGSIGLLAILLGGGYLLARKSSAVLERGVLLPQINQLVAGWGSQNVPESERLVTLMRNDSMMVREHSGFNGSDEEEKARELMKSIVQANEVGAEVNIRPGNAVNCKRGGRAASPRCNWWDARVYCGGRLPSVNQLEAWYNSEYAGGRKGVQWNDWFWSNEETATDARIMNFHDGRVAYGVKFDDHPVRCR